MSLADIKKKIQTDARREADEIIDKAKAQADEIVKETDDQIKEVQDSYKERFKEEKPEILNRREIVAKLDVNKIKLGAKQSLIQVAFDEALKKMSSLPKDKYLKFVESLLSQAVETGKEELLVGKSEKNITKTWLDSYNQKNKHEITISDNKLPISGGFILKNGDIETNCSFGMLLSWHREDLEADVVKRLFSA